MRSQIKYELALAVVMLVIGLVPVPIAVYFVGQAVVGPYEGDGGLIGLIGQIGADLLRLRLAAWTLVLSPYLIVQLLRAVAHWRRIKRDDVTRVTDSR